MNLAKLPTDFTHFQTLLLCSNGLHGVRVPILLSGEIPILIGKPLGTNLAPLVWFYRPVFEKAGNPPREWAPLVEANKSLDASVGVLHPEPNQTIVHSRDRVLVAAIRNDEVSASVTRLDLRPVGIAIHGDNTGLQFIGNVYVGNSIAGQPFAFRAG